MTFLHCGKISYSGLGIAQIKLRSLYGALERSKTRLQTRTIVMVYALCLLEYRRAVSVPFQLYYPTTGTASFALVCL